MDLLLLEDDEDLGQAVRDHLVGAGHRLQWCRRIADTETATPWAMALLDLHLGDGDGLALLRRWRQAGWRQPVIVLTARDQVSDRIRGLQAGADDYLVKPFDLDELLARVDAVARRTGPAIAIAIAIASASTSTSTSTSTNVPATAAAEATMAATAQPLAAGALRLDALAHALWRDGQRIDLTQMEWAVLDCLAQHSGRIYSRGEIEDRLHRQGLADASSNSLEVIVSRLRKKLGAGAISTHRGLGYRLEA